MLEAPLKARFLISSLFFTLILSSVTFCKKAEFQRIPEKEIVVVIPSYNNKDWYLKNLDSVFSQNYSNYSVIYLDDCSPDGTGDLVEQYLKDKDVEDKCLLIKNKVRYGQLFNRYKAIHSCNDDAIILLLDGDDWLKHSDVLSYLNELYTNEGILLSVGNASRSSTGQKIGYRDYTKEELAQYGFRQLGFRGVHPRTFYAGLFKKIKAQDLMHNGKFLMMATDVAFMLPLFEMAKDRYKYIHDILYVYNTDNAINLFKSKFEFQIYYDLITRNRKPYPQYTESSFAQPSKDQLLSYVIFMEKEQDVTEFFKRRESEGVFFDSVIKVGNEDPRKNRSLRTYCNHFSTLDIGYSLDQVYTHRVNFKDKLLKSLQKCRGQYVFLSTQHVLEADYIDFSSLLKTVEATGATGVFFGKGNNNLLEEKGYDVAPWDASYNAYLFNSWLYHDVFERITDCSGLLLKRDDCIKMVESLEIFHPNFHTFLAAFQSTAPADDLYLMVPLMSGELNEA